jgi:hypothetical protein
MKAKTLEVEAAAAFYIASLKHTHKHHEHITFWGPNHCGYALVISDGHTGAYSLEQATRLNDGESYIAVPVASVKALLSPEPYFRPHAPARFYDTPGPVVDNTRANWNRLIEAALPGIAHKPRPEVYRGARRSFSLPAPPAITSKES